jgi:hypothetical protein
MLTTYGEAVRARTANLPPKEAGYIRLTFVGLQQRLLSSIAAFAKTLTDQRLPVIALLICFAPSAPEFWLAAGQF